MTKRHRRRHRPGGGDQLLLTKDDGSGYTPEEIGDIMVQGAMEAGIHPAYVHAIKVCGFIVTEENSHLWDDEDIDEWNDAVGAGELLYGLIGPSG